jgi:hypothetical protein
LIDTLIRLDRRWIFLAMFLAVAIPVLTQPELPEQPTPMVQAVFDRIESLPPGSRVLISLDYDPASRPELGPMSDAFTRHCALRGHLLYFITLWPTGVPMIDDATDILQTEFAGRYQYGVNYLNLGYGAGQEAAIKLIATDLTKLFPVDSRGRPFALWPIARGVTSLQDMDLTVSVGAGYPGTKEWVQYAATPYPAIELVAGVTGVSAPPQYPYYPQQLIGMLPAIKGAAEYEAALAARYGTAGEALPALLEDRIAALATARRTREDIIAELAAAAGIEISHVRRILDGRVNCLPRAEIDALAPVLELDPQAILAAAEEDGCDYSEGRDYPSNYLNYAHSAYQDALKRMAPQLSAHLLMLVLILLGNIVYFLQRKRGIPQ